MKPLEKDELVRVASTMRRESLTYQQSTEAGVERSAIDPYLDITQICSPLGFLVEHLLQHYKPSEACLKLIAQQVFSHANL